jgi:Ca-activated chloride channel homolog
VRWFNSAWFSSTWVFALLLLIPLLAWRSRRYWNRIPAVSFPRVADALTMPQTVRQRWVRFPDALRLLALMSLIGAGAGPLWDQKPSRQISNSIGIQLLVDRSGSMASEDMVYEGYSQSRLEVVKKISHEFVFGARSVFGTGADLHGRPSDMIGLIAFAADPITLSPLTLSHEQLLPGLNSLRVAEGVEDGTAIGDAVTLAAARFELLDREQAGHLKSRVIILITDGENNLGTRSVVEAAELAHEWGVRIYTIAIRPGAEGIFDQHVIGDMETLSAETGGTTRVAGDGTALQFIYADIDRLEKSDIGVVKLDGKSAAFTFFVLAGLGLLALESLLRQTWLRRVP